MDPIVTKPPPPELFQFAEDAWTKPFWDAAREHRLTACQCASCGRFRMPPTAFCPNCRSQEVRWPTLSGRGRIYSYTVIARAVTPAMAPHLPYAPAVIELPDADGVRLISNVVGAPLEELAVGAAVQVAWDDREDGVTVPRFVLATNKQRGEDN